MEEEVKQNRLSRGIIFCTVTRLLLENYLLGSNIILYMLTAFTSLLDKNITLMISIPR